MFEYSDPGSPQNRFCGSFLPIFGGILPTDENPGFTYTSDSNQLVLWFRSNSDSIVGTGFELKWEAV